MYDIYFTPMCGKEVLFMSEVVKGPPIVFLDGVATFYLPCCISHQEELRLIRQYLEFDCPEPFPRLMFINYPDKDICYSLRYDRILGPVILNTRNFLEEHFYIFGPEIDIPLYDGRKVDS